MQDDKREAQGVRLAGKAVFYRQAFSLTSAIKIIIESKRGKATVGGKED